MQLFDIFIEIGVFNLFYDYVAVVFELYECKWSSFLFEYLEWMIEIFKNLNKQVFKFLFFFVFYVDGQYFGGFKSEQKFIFIVLSELIVCYEIILFMFLLFVEDGDLRVWLMDLGECNFNQV